MSAVTRQEVVEALRRGIPANAFHKFDWIESNKALANRIEAEGIAPPDGMVLVPKEPTFEMCRAGGFKWESPFDGGFPAAYKAMLAAAPEVKP